jgi:hypothetical protein
MMKFFESPVWTFLSVVIIAWITQRLASAWEKRKKIEETKLAIYMSWLPFLAEVYASTIYPEPASFSKRDFLKKKMEILGTLQLMGPDRAMDAFIAFCDLAEKAHSGDKTFDSTQFHRNFTELNYQLCCEIHSERRE